MTAERPAHVRLRCHLSTFALRATVDKLRMACQLYRPPVAKVGAGNGIRTRDFDLGKVALYH